MSRNRCMRSGGSRNPTSATALATPLNLRDVTTRATELQVDALATVTANLYYENLELKKKTSTQGTAQPRRQVGKASMSAVGSSADNAAAESFNATFKRETL
ncbi:hypothetical protein ABZV31_38060 [Streptomyces sp. NPDC005202]|uniref:hypothetical protein n=1 Tax=Streptomyces sp. NPDC005202 TaxID=3157021 RepID=UPI0033B1549B